ncbi:hypothetical protein HHL23_19435 [Chryseobacterium sp. RP-3-3]|uniref:Uncharacterized protein n=1 Tax=Chryseobacterium antibioticum TaxID=2728847 RepID=A0A7Y0FT43_9FLAO|nr:hypothetical protein [Chryseobacterium antibioticum]NML71952.1 hypothetical protein [Chryseobacterium antibioticum]
MGFRIFGIRDRYTKFGFKFGFLRLGEGSWKMEVSGGLKYECHSHLDFGMRVSGYMSLRISKFMD